MCEGMWDRTYTDTHALLLYIELEVYRLEMMALCGGKESLVVF
jgi:hypothetical protein